jgi:hypothetical protein
MDEAVGMSTAAITILRMYAHAALAMIEGGHLPAMPSSSGNDLEAQPRGTAVQLAGGVGEDEMVSFLLQSGW